MTKMVIAAIAAMLLAIAGIAMAADSFTVTAVGDEDADIGGGWVKSFKVLKVEWKANAVDGTKLPGTIPAQKGKLVMAVTNPGATAPTANYDIEIQDSQGVDVFGGALLNRHTSSTEQAFPKTGTDYFLPRPVYGPMTFSLSGNSQAGALGELFLYMVE